MCLEFGNGVSNVFRKLCIALCYECFYYRSPERFRGDRKLGGTTAFLCLGDLLRQGLPLRLRRPEALLLRA